MTEEFFTCKTKGTGTVITNPKHGQSGWLQVDGEENPHIYNQKGPQDTYGWVSLNRFQQLKQKRAPESKMRRLSMRPKKPSRWYQMDRISCYA